MDQKATSTRYGSQEEDATRPNKPPKKLIFAEPPKQKNPSAKVGFKNTQSKIPQLSQK